MKNNNNDIVLIVESKIIRIQKLIVNVLCIGILVFATYNFNENPPFILALDIILVGCLLLPGRSSIIVYKHGVELRVSNEFFKWIFRKWYFEFKDIESIDADLRLTKKKYIFSELSGSQVLRLSMWNIITIKSKTGMKKELVIGLLKEDIVKALSLAKKLSGNKFILTGL